jgi:hypothetical protein
MIEMAIVVQQPEITGKYQEREAKEPSLAVTTR